MSPWLSIAFQRANVRAPQILTGQIKSPDDIPEGDFRKTMPRFQPENFDINMQLVHQIGELAKKKGGASGGQNVNPEECKQQ